jgi:AraC-like DNA-binding protein
VALRCGFVSSQYFATVFAKRFGATPTGYRERSTGTLPPPGCAMMRS